MPNLESSDSATFFCQRIIEDKTHWYYYSRWWLLLPFINLFYFNLIAVCSGHWTAASLAYPLWAFDDEVFRWTAMLMTRVGLKDVFVNRKFVPHLLWLYQPTFFFLFLFLFFNTQRLSAWQLPIPRCNQFWYFVSANAFPGCKNKRCDTF